MKKEEEKELLACLQEEEIDPGLLRCCEGNEDPGKNAGEVMGKKESAQHEHKTPEHDAGAGSEDPCGADED